MHDNVNLDLVQYPNGKWGYQLALHELPKGECDTSTDALNRALAYEPVFSDVSPDAVRVRTTKYPQNPTPWAVHCKASCGPRFLSAAEYDQQLSRPDDRWACPVCGSEAYWDDDNHESFFESDAN